MGCEVIGAVVETLLVLIVLMLNIFHQRLDHDSVVMSCGLVKTQPAYDINYLQGDIVDHTKWSKAFCKILSVFVATLDHVNPTTRN